MAGVLRDKSAEYVRGWGSNPLGQVGRTVGAVGQTVRDYGTSIACKVWTGDEGGAFADIFVAELTLGRAPMGAASAGDTVAAETAHHNS